MVDDTLSDKAIRSVQFWMKPLEYMEECNISQSRAQPGSESVGEAPLQV